MKNTELRIGNYIEYAGVICEVEEIHNKTITTNGVNAPISSFLSIPLTEEWLLKFGFNFKSKKDGTRGVYSNRKMNFILSNSGNVYTMRNKLIPYVHTFQNHYYYSILDEEELTLNK